jgi:hypothetical protein
LQPLKTLCRQGVYIGLTACKQAVVLGGAFEISTTFVTYLLSGKYKESDTFDDFSFFF